jgi:hypothetical protein
MFKKKFKMLSSLFLVFLISLTLLLSVGVVEAVDIMKNGSFETGDFTNWVTKDIAAPFFPLNVVGPGVSPGFGFFLSAPTEGNFAAVHGFDGGGPDTIEIAQDVVIPMNSCAALTFDWRAAWDLMTFCVGCSHRMLDLDIEPTGGGSSLETTNILTAMGGTINLDTGPNSATVDLSAFAGTDIRVNFKSTIPDNFSGPAFLQLDNVVLILSENVNDRFPPLGPGDVSTSFVSTTCGETSSGTFIISASFVNTSSDLLSGLFFRVSELTGDNVLCNATNSSGETVFCNNSGETGTILTVPLEGDYSDGLLEPGESFDIDFVIGLESLNPFDFSVDLIAVVE